MRKALANNLTLVNRLCSVLADEDLDNPQKLDVREFILRIFVYLLNYRHTLITVLKNSLKDLKFRLKGSLVTASQDRKDLIN